MRPTTVLWRRLDAPGHDACRVVRTRRGWRLEGTAIFLEKRSVARLDYGLECDRSWRSSRGDVIGWVGARAVRLAIARVRAGWAIGGKVVPGLADCLDLDFGFTPATNLFQLRRLDLAVGASAACPVAWLDTGGTTLRRLFQVYERRSPTTYRYEADSVPYRALLRIDSTGFVRDYPRLWRMEPTARG
jgi:uncharacterized protein